MNRPLLVGAVALSALMSFTVACSNSDIFNTDNLWTATLTDPTPQNGVIEFCPAILSTGFDPTTGQPARLTTIPAPTPLQGLLDSPDTDIWTFTLQSGIDVHLGAPAFKFDLGPFGNVYESRGDGFQLASDTGDGQLAEPALVNVVRTATSGTRKSKEEMTLVETYTMDCTTIVVGDKSCACTPVSLAWSLTVQ